MRLSARTPFCMRQRFLPVLLLAAWAGPSPVSSREMEDVVYLKDGTTVRGIVIERILGESVEIQVQGGNVRVYAMDDISRIAREPVRGAEEIEPAGDGSAFTVEGAPAPEIEETSAPETEPAPPPEVERVPVPEAETVPAPEVEPELRRETREATGSMRRNPWLAFGLSALVPGAGQFYNGQYAKGVPQLGAAIAGSALVFSAVRDNYEDIHGDWIDADDDDQKAVYGGLLWLGGLLWSVIDAPASANRINRESRLELHPVLGRYGTGTRLLIRY